MTVENIYVAAENGIYVSKKETIELKADAGNVLVKVAFSTCDPYDGLTTKIFLADGTRLGGEACGTIIDVGEGVDQTLLNKKISFHKQGTWTQYL